MRRKIVFGIILSATQLLACFYAYPDTGSKDRCNVILITLNSLRADHLGCYGYNRKTSPHIDAIAGRAVVFDDAIAQSHWTLPSQASLLTSRYVQSHGVCERTQRLSSEEVTLPEILKIYGYKTAAFVGGLDMVAEYGLDQGFDSYSDETGGRPMAPLEENMPKALAWLQKNKKHKFFLFIQAYDIHQPYRHPAVYDDPHDPDYAGVLQKYGLEYALLKNIQGQTLLLDGKSIKLEQKDMDYIAARYDGGIAYVDDMIGRLWSYLAGEGLLDETLIIITSEHGEELSDHGTFDRFGANNLYDEVVHVPFILWAPGVLSPERIGEQVQLIDIMPTILDYCEIPVNKESQGRSLRPLVEGKPHDRAANSYAYAEALPEKWMVRTKAWKLVYDHGRYELYDLMGDPREQKNRVSENPGIAYGLMQKLFAWRQTTKTRRSFNAGDRVELTQGMISRLREAGYW